MVYEHQEARTSATTSVTRLAKHFGQDCLTDERETSKMPAANIARKSRKLFIKTLQEDKQEEWAEQQ